MSLFSCNALKCVSISNQECKIRPEVVNINSNKPLFYPYSILVNKCSVSCNNINNPYSKLRVPDIVKNTNVRVFNQELMKQDIYLGMKLVYVYVD